MRRQPLLLNKSQQELQFSVKSGLEIQKRQLKIWRRLLSVEAYGKLKQFISKKQCMSPQSGFDIIRGEDLNDIVDCIWYNMEFENL